MVYQPGTIQQGGFKPTFFSVYDTTDVIRGSHAITGDKGSHGFFHGVMGGIVKGAVTLTTLATLVAYTIGCGNGGGGKEEEPYTTEKAVADVIAEGGSRGLLCVKKDQTYTFNPSNERVDTNLDCTTPPGYNISASVRAETSLTSEQKAELEKYTQSPAKMYLNLLNGQNAPFGILGYDNVTSKELAKQAVDDMLNKNYKPIYMGDKLDFGAVNINEGDILSLDALLSVSDPNPSAVKAALYFEKDGATSAIIELINNGSGNFSIPALPTGNGGIESGNYSTKLFITASSIDLTDPDSVQQNPDKVNSLEGIIVFSLNVQPPKTASLSAEVSNFVCGEQISDPCSYHLTVTETNGVGVNLESEQVCFESVGCFPPYDPQQSLGTNKIEPYGKVEDDRAFIDPNRPDKLTDTISGIDEKGNQVQATVSIDIP